MYKHLFVILFHQNLLTITYTLFLAVQYNETANHSNKRPNVSITMFYVTELQIRKIFFFRTFKFKYFRSFSLFPYIIFLNVDLTIILASPMMRGAYRNTIQAITSFLTSDPTFTSSLTPLQKLISKNSPDSKVTIRWINIIMTFLLLLHVLI